jgi:hypothetical protein
MTLDQFEDCARGPYQRELLKGRARWSGAGLTGMAKTYGASYKRSRASLVERVKAKAAELGATVRWAGGTAHEGPLRLVVTGPDGTELVFG